MRFPREGRRGRWSAAKDPCNWSGVGLAAAVVRSETARRLLLDRLGALSLSNGQDRRPTVLIAPLNRWLPLALVVLVACWLRVHDLARRPMHADEANQAVKVGELLERGHYAFDARDHHGPTLYYAALPIAWLRGQRTLAALDETTVRLVPAIAGTIGVLLLGLLVGGALRPGNFASAESGPKAPVAVMRWPAIAAAAFMAVSPPAVYYSRYFVQETLLVTFLLGALVCGQRWWRSGHVAWALGGGACVGLMLATKENAPLYVIAVAIALLAARAKPPASIGLTRSACLAALTAIAVAVLFYSSFGTHVAGLRDVLAALRHGFDRATGDSGHEKPWWYYARLFAWQRSGGVVFEQIALSALALGGVVVAFVSGQKILRGAAVYLAVIAVVLSLTPYKTPWHAVQVVPAMALLAAGALAAVPGNGIAAALGVVALATQCFQTHRVAFVYPADARNPYAYVHSSPDVLKFRALADAAVARAPSQPVRVISEEYWPLPWYLRGLPSVGYWSAPPDDCDGALVIVSASQAGAVRARLHGDYRESILGLRPGFICVVFTPSP